MSGSDPRLYRPHVPRNRDPIPDVLKRVLPPHGLVLEVASGSGEHAVYFAKALRHLIWQPSVPDAEALDSIAAHRAAEGSPNLRASLKLDVMAAQWPLTQADAIVCCNMVHIAPWSASKGLIAGAARLLLPGGVLYLYSPYKIADRHTAASNQEFDAYLRRQNLEWGIRDLDASWPWGRVMVLCWSKQRRCRPII